MCFSASASFAAGGALLIVGALTLRKAQQKRELPYAAIPLLFGMQQLVEGVIWLTFRFDSPVLNPAMTLLYSLFSHVLWPIYVPFAVLLLEPVPWRRKMLAAFLAAGLGTGLYLLVSMLQFPIVSRAVSGHIDYDSPHFFIGPVIAGYLAATCISMLFSSHKAVKLFGIAAMLSFVASYAVYTQWFFSIWCFFAAILSGIVFLHFTVGRSSSKEAANGMAL
jgi:hypothetical protein